jgi:hypothetical protein
MATMEVESNNETCATPRVVSLKDLAGSKWLALPFEGNPKNLSVEALPLPSLASYFQCLNHMRHLQNHLLLFGLRVATG